MDEETMNNRLLPLIPSWRWFGNTDPISLEQLAQIGVPGIVSACHHLPNGETWSVEAIKAHQEAIASHGMRWEVVESLPVSEGIKIQSSDWDRLVNNYCESLKNLAACGIRRICYNFMPVLDWARTDLTYVLPGGGRSMYFDYPTFIAFDVFILNRPKAEEDYTPEQLETGERRFAALTESQREDLAYSLIVATQGFIDGAVDPSDPAYKERFLELLATYRDIDSERLRKHLVEFLQTVIPVAEAHGIVMAIHPDDPPFPVLGLPRIVSTLSDFQAIFSAVPSLANGITFCTGSLSAQPEMELYGILDQFADRIHFAHLRNTQLLTGRNFYESGHLEGRVDMYRVMKKLLVEQALRRQAGRKDDQIPMRPDHGIAILDDHSRTSLPGYPLIGRLKGYAELLGLEWGVRRSLEEAASI